MAFGPWLWDEAPAPAAVAIWLQWWGEGPPGERVSLASPAQPQRRTPGRQKPATVEPPSPGGASARSQEAQRRTTGCHIPAEPPSPACGSTQSHHWHSQGTGSSVRSIEYDVRTGDDNFKRYVRDVGSLQLLVSAPEGSAGACSAQGVSGLSDLVSSPKRQEEGLLQSAAPPGAETCTGAECDIELPGFRGLGLSPESPVDIGGSHRAARDRVIGRVPVDLSPLAEDGRLDGARPTPHPRFDALNNKTVKPVYRWHAAREGTLRGLWT